jgi:Cu(I)/Ag(I) efflux system membrane fusion protein
MRKIYVIIASALIVSCSNNISNTNEKKDNNVSATIASTDPSSNMNPNATKKLVSLLNNYYSLKDALVATDANKAITAANTMMISVDSFTNSLTQNEATSETNLNIDTIRTNLNRISGNSSKKVDDIRMYFSKISNPLFAICTKAGLKNAMVFKEHCPMAFDDTGAYWLSNYTEIKNPYFGKKMIECGEVEDSLK